MTSRDLFFEDLSPGQRFESATMVLTEAEIVALIDSLTDQVAAWMQENARWQDRTGAARAGLYADIEHMAGQAVYLLMSHDVTLSYTWFLEYAHAGRFAILGDAVDTWSPVVFRGVEAILRRHSS